MPSGLLEAENLPMTSALFATSPFAVTKPLTNLFFSHRVSESAKSETGSDTTDDSIVASASKPPSV